MTVDPDYLFFAQHQRRRAHIRDAKTGEFSDEFRSLGDHQEDRRRVLMYRTPNDPAKGGGMIIKIPFLAFQDEEIRDEDDTLLPILKEIMSDAAAGYGIKRK